MRRRREALAQGAQAQHCVYKTPCHLHRQADTHTKIQEPKKLLITKNHQITYHVEYKSIQECAGQFISSLNQNNDITVTALQHRVYSR